MTNRNYRFIVTGGGTGGHIFPAVAIADALRRRYSSCEILFVGAEGRMEMERVPRAGYPIKAIPVAGLDRRHLLRNFGVLAKLLKAIRLAKQYTLDFQPDLVIGVGGYVSAPTVLSAQKLGIPTLLQEQNGFAGVANKRLAKRARAICVAYEGMERFFPADKIHLTGNPIREVIEKKPLPSREVAMEKLGFIHRESPTLVMVGGSLGALTLNESIESGLEAISASGINLLWQTGKTFFPRAKQTVEKLSHEAQSYILPVPFIDDMPLAYAASDLMISRAGASTISEIQCLGKAAILVPSPNVAEDHQTHNALALVKKEAASMVSDTDARAHLVEEALRLIQDHTKLKRFAQNALTMRLPDAADRIVEIIDHILHDAKAE